MRRRLAVFLVICSGVAAAQLHSQIPASQVVASISGRVVDAVTGKAIAGAAVTMQPAHKPPGSCGVSNFGDGQFLCEVFEAGEFRLGASFRGYSWAGFGMRAPDDAPQPFDLAAGEHATDVTLRMWKNGAITGRAVDAAGDPIVGAAVSAFIVSPAGVRLRFAMPRTTTTDDRGIYRLADLPRDRYVIALTRRPSSSAPSSPIFFPNVASLAAARGVEVAAGADATGIDFAEVSTRTFAVSGRLLGRASSGPAGYESHSTLIRLLPADAPDTPAGFDVSATEVFAQVGGAGARDRQGAFTFTNVPPGKYVVRIVDYPRLVGPNMVTSFGGIAFGSPYTPVPRADTMWAEAPVTVTDHDVTDVPVMLTKAARLSGRIVFEDAAAQQAPKDTPIILMRADGREYGDMPFGVSEADGTFRTVGVPPGPYALVAFPALTSSTRWRMTSVLLGGRNVVDAPFDVGTTDITDVVVTLRLRMCTLSGNVRDASGALRPDASLYILSTDRSLLAPEFVPSTAGVPREIRPNRHGAYSTELPDGDYYVVAVADHVAGWYAPEKLAELAKIATRISIAPGEQKTLDVIVRR